MTTRTKLHLSIDPLIKEQIREIAFKNRKTQSFIVEQAILLLVRELQA